MEFRRDSYEFFVRELFCWQYEWTDSYYNMLIHIYRKADLHNRWILENAYPQLGKAMEDWEAAGDNGNELFVRVLGIKQDEKGNWTNFDPPTEDRSS